jgi:hypothetical protein
MRAEYLCIFEDELHSNLYPLTYVRPVFELRCGIHVLREKISAVYDGVPIVLFCRKELEEITRESTGCVVNALDKERSVLFINGRVLLQKPVPLDGPEGCWVKNNTVLYARLYGKNAQAVSTENLFPV